MNQPINIEKKAEQVALWSLLVNLLFAIAKALVGFFGNTYALIADAIESMGDVFSSLLVLLGIRVAKRPPDENHPYGHGKVEPLITFVVVGILVISATIIVIQSIHYITTPHSIPKSFTLYFLGGIILIKEIMYRYVKRMSRETKSTSLHADAWHHRSDAISSLCAFVGILFALLLGKSFASADDWAALIAALLLYYNAYLILRPALGEIMDEHMYSEMVDTIRLFGKKTEGIILIEKCYVRKSGMRFHVDLHAHVKGEISVFDGHAIAHRLKENLMSQMPEIQDVLVHIEPSDCVD
jgi:cation diffusion facilitator family transporter